MKEQNEADVTEYVCLGTPTSAEPWKQKCGDCAWWSLAPGYCRFGSCSYDTPHVVREMDDQACHHWQAKQPKEVKP